MIGQEGERFFALRGEETFGSEFLFALFQHFEECAFAGQFHGFDDELVVGARRVGGDAARADDFEAFFGADREFGQGAFPADGVDDGLIVFEAGIHMA